MWKKSYIKIAMALIVCPLASYYIYDYNHRIYINHLENYARQLREYTFNVRIENDMLVISHDSDDPSYWLKFLIKHNIKIEKYEMLPNGFISYARPEEKYLKRVIFDNHESPERKENIEVGQPTYKISFIKK